MAKAEFRVDEVLGEVIIADPPLNLFGTGRRHATFEGR